MYTILVGTDFSEAAEDATQYAALLAQKINATIVLFHGCTEYNKASKEKNADCENRLKTECFKIWEKNKVECKWVLNSKSGSKEIAKQAEKCKADIIITGITEASRLEKNVLGSMTQDLIKSGKTPVMAIPEGVKFSPITKIVLAVGNIVPDFILIKKLENFASAFNAHIQVVHVMSDKGDSTISFAEINELINKTGYENISFTTLKGKDIAKELNDFISREKSSLLVIVRKNLSYMHPLFSGLAGKMTFDSPVPLLVFNEEEFNIGPLEIKAEEILG